MHPAQLAQILIELLRVTTTQRDDFLDTEVDEIASETGTNSRDALQLLESDRRLLVVRCGAESRHGFAYQCSREHIKHSFTRIAAVVSA